MIILSKINANILKSIGINLSGSRQGVKDIAVSFIPQFVGVFSGLISSILIARGLGPAGLGNYALILSYVSIASIVSDLGIGQTAIRYASLAVASDDISWQKSVLRWAFKMRLLMVLVASAILGFLAPYITDRIWHHKDLTAYIYIALIGSIFTPLATVPTIYFQSIRKFSTNSLISSVQRSISLIGVLILSLFNWWQIIYVIYSSVIATVIGAFAFILAVPKGILFGLNDNSRSSYTVRDFLKCPVSSSDSKESADNPSHFAIYQMALTIIVTLSSQIDIWLMGFFLDEQQIGIYSAALRFTVPFGIVIATINTVLWPRASACITNLSKLSLLRKTFRLCFVITFFGIGYSYFAPFSMSFIFGNRYTDGMLLAQLLCARQCITLLYCSISLVGYSMGLIKHYVWIALVCFIVQVFCNIVLLPKIGFYGAAIGSIASETLLLILGGSIIYVKYKALKREALSVPVCL